MSYATGRTWDSDGIWEGRSFLEQPAIVGRVMASFAFACLGVLFAIGLASQPREASPFGSTSRGQGETATAMAPLPKGLVPGDGALQHPRDPGEVGMERDALEDGMGGSEGAHRRLLAESNLEQELPTRAEDSHRIP